MSATYSAARFVELATGCNTRVREKLAKINEFLSRHEHAMRLLSRREQDALRELVVAILPSLTPAAIARADKLLGAVVVGRTDWATRIASERARLQEVIARTEADPKYAQRGLVGFGDPDGLPATIARLQQEKNDHQDVIARCDHPRMEALIACQYGTALYATGFWRMSYYADWKAGDEVLERFDALEHFGQVREKYLAAQSFLGGADAWIARLEAESEGIRAVVQAHDEAQKRLAALDTWALDEAQGEVRERLALRGLVALAPWLSADPEVYAVALRCEGQRAQGVYLRGIVENGIKHADRELTGFRARLETDIGRFSAPRRAGKTFPTERVDKRLAAPDKLFKRYYERQEPAYNAVGRFQRFERGRLDEDFLWWELMVGAATAAVVVPEVAAFLAAHPNHVALAEPEGAENALAEAAAQIAETVGDSDLGDVS